MKEPDDFAREITASFAAYVENELYTAYKMLEKRCESPIEKVMLSGLLYFFNKLLDDACGWYANEQTDPYKSDNGAKGYAVTCMIQQPIGDYRADFLFRVAIGAQVKFIVIECDGHDFHERTKEQAARDRSRDRWMTENNIMVLRFTGSEIWADNRGCANQVYRIVCGMIDAPRG